MSAIPFTLYQEIMNDIAPAEIEDMDVTIKLSVLGLVMSLMNLIFPSLVESFMKKDCLVRMN